MVIYFKIQLQAVEYQKKASIWYCTSLKIALLHHPHLHFTRAFSRYKLIFRALKPVQTFLFIGAYWAEFTQAEIGSYNDILNTPNDNLILCCLLYPGSIVRP